MRSNRGKALVALLAAFVHVLSPAAGALGATSGEPSVAAGYARSVEMKPGALTGKLLYSDGKTPVAKAPVRVWSVTDQEFVLEAMTDEKGAYNLGQLEEGRYLIVFGDRVTVEIRVAKDAKDGVSTLDVIVPRGKVAFAQMAQQQRAVVLTVVAATEGQGDGEEGEKGGEGGGGGLLHTVVVGAAGGLIAVAVIDIFDPFEEKKVVSP